MQLNKKLFTVTGLLAGVVFMASMTTIQQGPLQQGPQQQGPQQPQAEVKYTNLKVLPKSIKKATLDRTMREWGAALGVRCNFCHANNPTTNRTDYALDTKPEKLMARKMYKMAGNINKKYFGAKKDSLGMMKETGITCNSCHKGTAHPKVVYANIPRPAGAPGAAPAGFGGGAQGAAPAGAPRPVAPATPPTNK
jgi:hypothetical protein